jgi:hypothetical protein
VPTSVTTTYVNSFIKSTSLTNLDNFLSDHCHNGCSKSSPSRTPNKKKKKNALNSHSLNRQTPTSPPPHPKQPCWRLQETSRMQTPCRESTVNPTTTFLKGSGCIKTLTMKRMELNTQAEQKTHEGKKKKKKKKKPKRVIYIPSAFCLHSRDLCKAAASLLPQRLPSRGRQEPRELELLGFMARTKGPPQFVRELSCDSLWRILGFLCSLARTHSSFSLRRRASHRREAAILIPTKCNGEWVLLTVKLLCSLVPSPLKGLLGTAFWTYQSLNCRLLGTLSGLPVL